MKILEDLIERFQLYAVCSDCVRMERLPLEQMIIEFGSDLTIDSVRRRLRCTRCRQRTEDIRIVYVGEHAKVSGFHYRNTRPSITGALQPFNSSVDSRVRPKPSTPT